MFSQLADVKSYIDRVVKGEDLSIEESRGVMDLIMTGGATEAQIASFLTALRMKGETVEEITGCARVMREKVTRIEVNCENMVDTCGTGGDQAGTFNISTTAAFVAAGAGLTVAKHGNRSVSSRCGSADLLEALGVNLDVTPREAAASIEKVGIGFLFAPSLHLAMKHAVKPRRDIGLRTIFNLLGPLTNPAGAKRQVLGVYAPELTDLLARVLLNLGSEKALVVYGTEGIDEISICSETRISHLQERKIKTYYLKPEDMGFNRAGRKKIRGGDAAQNAEITLSVLRGEGGPCRDVVILNAAAALVAGGEAEDFQEGVLQARNSIDKGCALDKLDSLREFSRRSLCS